MGKYLISCPYADSDLDTNDYHKMVINGKRYYCYKCDIEGTLEDKNKHEDTACLDWGYICLDKYDNKTFLAEKMCHDIKDIDIERFANCSHYIPILILPTAQVDLLEYTIDIFSKFLEDNGYRVRPRGATYEEE